MAIAFSSSKWDDCEYGTTQSMKFTSIDNYANKLGAKSNLRKYFVVLFLAFGLLGATTSNSLAQDRGVVQNILMRTLTVSGRGVETIPTTLSEVRLGVEVQGKTAEVTQQEAAKRSKALVALLKSRQQVEKLVTTGISLNPVYSYNNNTQKLTGYTATNTVSFRIPTESIGNLLDESVRVGATRIEGISFTATDSAISAAEQAALKKATQNAQQQANSVLSALNFTAKEIVSIQINNAAPPPPQPLSQFDNLAARTESKVATPVIGGEQKVEAGVTLQISY